MPEPTKPSSQKPVPNPAHCYERSDPHRESGQGRLDSDEIKQALRPDQIQESAPNKSDPTRQINAEETMRQGERRDLGGSPRKK